MGRVFNINIDEETTILLCLIFNLSQSESCGESGCCLWITRKSNESTHPVSHVAITHLP